METENYWVDASQMSTDNYSTIGSHRNVNLTYDTAKTNSLSKSMLGENMKSNLKTATNKESQQIKCSFQSHPYPSKVHPKSTQNINDIAAAN